MEKECYEGHSPEEGSSSNQHSSWMSIIPKALVLELIKEYKDRVIDVKQARLVEETHPKREME